MSTPYKMKGSPMQRNFGLNKENVKKIEKGIEGYSDKEKKGIVDRNLINYHYRNTVGSAGADSVQAVLNTYGLNKKK